MGDSLIVKLSEMGLKAIDWATMTTAQLFNFIEKEAPLLLDEWLKWNLTTSIIGVLVGIILLGLFFWFAVYEIKNEAKISESSEGSIYILVVPGFIIGILMFSCNIMDMLQILIAPRIWILENIKDLVK